MNGIEIRDYESLRPIVEVRGSNKVILPGGRKARGYSLPDEKVAGLLRQMRLSGKFISPYSKGVRTDHLMALASLGVNCVWSMKEVVISLRGIMTDSEHWDSRGTAWERFEARRSSSRHDGTIGKDIEDKIIDNFRSFRRLCKDGGLNPCGYRLKQIGCCVDLFRKIEYISGQRCVSWFIRLNTHSADPLLMNVRNLREIPAVIKSL